MDIKTKEISCISCGVSFWITESHYNDLRKTYEYFHCPNGHSQYFSAQTDVEKYEKLYKKEKEKADYFSGELDCKVEDITCLYRRISALQGVITKMKNKEK